MQACTTVQTNAGPQYHRFTSTDPHRWYVALGVTLAGHPPHPHVARMWTLYVKLQHASDATTNSGDSAQTQVCLYDVVVYE